MKPLRTFRTTRFGNSYRKDSFDRSSISRFSEAGPRIHEGLLYTLGSEIGLKFDDEKKRKIVHDSYRDTANHINKHRIFQRTIDGFKLTSFLAYHTAVLVVETTSHGGGHDPAREASKAGIQRLVDLLKLETSSVMNLCDADQGYLMSMLYAEVTDNCEVGIGPNGLGTVFTFLARIRPDEDRLRKL